ncbi:MAG: TatD family hydrolase [Oscillospiraceae bacterium]|nr:TatD family hydrolase [Oscillospiraceae bacterium]
MKTVVAKKTAAVKKMKMRYFDTHAHYDDKRFNHDRDAVLSSLTEHGVELVVNPGADMRSSRAALRLAEKYPFIYAAVGIHPHDAAEVNEENVSELKRMAAMPKVVAIGEIGLDYYRDLSPRDVQKRSFERLLQLAQELQIPIIVHDRDAHADTLDILRGFKLKAVVYHCFSGSLDYARTLLGLGWYLSFTGSITFKGAYKSHETIRYMPIDRLMLETDAPYLAPQSNRGERNDSTLMPEATRLIADLRGITLEELTETTFETGKRFFGIPCYL